MKICLIVDDYLPHSIKVAAKMMHELAVEFIAQGHTVLVITPVQEKDERKSGFYLENLDGVEVMRFPSGKVKNVSKPTRLVNEILLSYRAWKYGKKYFLENPFDLIVYYSPSIFWSGLISRLKKLWKSKTFLVLRDFFPQWVIDNGMIGKNSLPAIFFRWMEKKNYEVADTIGIQSPANIDWFLQNHSAFGNKVKLLYNWATFTNGEKEKSFHYRKKLGLINKIIYFYGGNIGHAQDMKNILFLAEKMQNEKDAFFLLVGSGDEVPLIRSGIVEKKLTNLQLLDPLPQKEFDELLSEIDVGLFTLHPAHKAHNFPGKLLGYMVHSKPILGAVNTGNDLKETIHAANAGFVSLAGDIETFYKNAKKLLNIEIRNQTGEKSKQLLKEKFSTESATTTILSNL